jgi:hypothetical protein
MIRYDPRVAPDPDQWNALPELERIHMVERYHRKARIRLPKERLHAVLHVVVENQVAAGDELPVAATVQRLMRQGLDRHEAVHAVASVMAAHLHQILAEKPEMAPEIHQPYFDELATLTPESWRERFG